jgi:hypothetical protein
MRWNVCRAVLGAALLYAGAAAAQPAERLLAPRKNPKLFPPKHAPAAVHPELAADPDARPYRERHVLKARRAKNPGPPPVVSAAGQEPLGERYHEQRTRDGRLRPETKRAAPRQPGQLAE